MLNFEKKIDKLIYLIQESNDCAEFLALTGERCGPVSCYECAEILQKWLLTEYVPPKINWDNIPIDTKTIVWDCEERKLKRHFAGITKGEINIEWISIKDRLPKNDNYVLVCYHFENEPSKSYIGLSNYYIFSNKPRWRHEGKGTVITHWADLPELPKEEETWNG